MYRDEAIEAGSVCIEMCLCVSELQASPAPLPSDQLLRSGAVIFPGKSCGQPLTHSLLCRSL